MLSRRGFLGIIGSLPFIGRFVPPDVLHVATPMYGTAVPLDNIIRANESYGAVSCYVVGVIDGKEVPIDVFWKSDSGAVE